MQKCYYLLPTNSFSDINLYLVQGFWWYGRRLRIDEDGDVADEFLDEILSPTSSGDESRAAQPRFEVKYTTRPAPVRKQAITIDGNVHPSMEFQGLLRWV